MFKILVVLVALCNVSYLNALSAGSCSAGPVIPDFDVTRYVGKWYQIEKVLAPFEPNLKCVTADYSAINATHIFVDNKGLRTESNEPSGIQGTAYVVDPTKPNQLKLQFPNIPAGSYNIIATDYTGYTLIYSCTQIIPFVLKQELTWVLSRTKVMKEETRQHLRNVLKENGFKTASSLVFTDQVNC